ncbi:MAG: T9SS type A sorting domain-containing protein [bacterium]
MKVFTKYSGCREGRSKVIRLSGYSVFVLVFALSTSLQAQWKKLASFPDISIGLVYFQTEVGHPEIGFVGSRVADKNGNRDNAAQLWKTINGGRSWKNIADPSWLGAVRDINFKDQSNGWCTIFHVAGDLPDGGGCYRTTDGGETWTLLKGTSGLCNSVYFNRNSHLLVLSFWKSPAIRSLDEGISWNTIPFSSDNTNGFAFFDDNHALLSRVPSGAINFLLTSDGGLSWQTSSFAAEAYQPLAIFGTSTAFAICENTSENKLFRTDDFGQSWHLLYQFDPRNTFQVSGCICGSFNRLVIQASFPSSIMISTDSGATWESICGPSSNGDTRFYVHGDSIFAGDLLGNLFLNTSGSGSAPRIQIEKGNATRHLTGSTTPFPVTLYYPENSYNESVDSVSITVRFSGPIRFVSDSLFDGWRLLQSSQDNSSYTVVLERLTSTVPPTNSPMIKLFLQTLVAPEKTAQITLEDINFNQDVTFHECTISALSKMDSLIIDIKEFCGDSTLSKFMNGILPLRIISLRPNPANGNDLIMSLSVAEPNEALSYSVYDVLGREMLHSTIPVGLSEIQIPIQTLAEGMYYVRLSAGGATESRSFTKIK